MNRFWTLAVIAAAALASPQARADALVFTASLSGPAESPPNASPGIGFAEVDFDTSTNMMRVRVTFSGLVGTTTASHIHAATPTPGTGTAGVATTTPTFAGFPLGVTSGSYDSTLDMTQASSYNPAYVTANGGTVASAEAALLASMIAGTSYLNIHTTVATGGEIRGFLSVAPEPSPLALAGVAGTAALAATRLRQGRRVS